MIQDNEVDLKQEQENKIKLKSKVVPRLPLPKVEFKNQTRTRHDQKLSPKGADPNPWDGY